MDYQRKIRFVGLALAAVFLFGAIAAASASAAKFEAEPGFPVKFKATGGAGFLETKAGHSVTCKEAAGEGEVSGEKAVAKVKVKFKGCFAEHSTEMKCTTVGAAEGEIVTNAIKGEPVTLGTEKSEAGLLLEPEAAGGLFAEFKCKLLVESGGFKVLIDTTVKVKGSIIGKVPKEQLNKFRKTLNLEFIAVKGKPVPSQVEGKGEEHFLETTAEVAPPFEAFGFKEEASGIQELVPGETKTEALAGEIKLVP